MPQDSLFSTGRCDYTPRFTTSAMTRYAASYTRGVALCPPLTRRASAPLARPGLAAGALARQAGQFVGPAGRSL